MMEVSGSLQQAWFHLAEIERDLRQSRARLQGLTALINRSPMVVFRWRLTPGWPVDYVSDNVAQFGFLPFDFTSGRVTWTGIIYPDDVLRLEAEMEDGLAQGQRSFTRCYRIFDHAGEMRWIEDHTTALFDADGSLTHFESVLLDITERRQTEEALQLAHLEMEERVRCRTTDLAIANEALRKSETRFRTLSDMAPIGIFEADGRGCITYTNTRWQAITGLDAQASLRLGWVRAIHPDDRARVLPGWIAAGYAEREFTGEIRFCIPQGEPRWALVHGTPLLDAAGRFKGYVGTVEDITTRKQEEERREIFVHTVSHDLRVPLTIILGQAGRLQQAITRGGHNGELGRCAESIRSSAQRMNGMIGDMVELARIEGGQLDILPEPMVLAPFIRAMLRRAALVLQTERISLQVPPDLPQVLADSNRLERILLNLLSNAQKYADAGTPINVRAYREDAEVIIAVKDNGQGVDPVDQPRLFERFYRAQNGHINGGVGLGLFISRMLVEAQGGRIWIDSTPGQGSTFSFSVPVAAATDNG